jgi:TRAP-type mannitol/chloroaromatic compound transport system substrate-binding protein
LSFYVNKDEWAKLPSDYQAIFRAAAKEAEVTMQARYDSLNPPALERLLAYGVQTKPFAEDIMVKAHKVALQLLEDSANDDPEYRKVYSQWKKARSASFKWFGAAEAAYAQFSFPRG